MVYYGFHQADHLGNILVIKASKYLLDSNLIVIYKIF